MTFQKGTRFLALWIAGCSLFAAPRFVHAQSSSYERVFQQSKTTIEQTLKTMQSNMSGRLPVLDGFAKPGEYPLDGYQRGYFQATVEITSTGNGSLVRVTTKITAWYSDPKTSHSGYQLLTSNGRLETDILDQLEEQLGKSLPASNETTSTAAPAPKAPAESKAAPAASQAPTQSPTQAPIQAKTQPAISAPAPKFQANNQALTSALKEGLSSPGRPAEKTPEQLAAEKTENSLQSEVDSLQEVLKNTAHPKNLVAVKKSGTPVVATPSLSAKPEFLASMHDEFEMIDFNADWVHVRISGLSRGWIWRNNVEMPEGIPDTAAHSDSGLVPAADLFHVIREETAPFPGDWEPLRSKTVKIISVQKTDESEKNAGPKERLEYAKFLLDKSYQDLAKKPKELQGVVVIFDSADGGMIAATAATLQQWKAGTLSDAALWHQCFFDPPETFDSAAPSKSE